MYQSFHGNPPRPRIRFPAVAKRRLTFEFGRCQLEPGEVDTFCADFVIAGSPATYEIVTHITNPKQPWSKPQPPVGWTSISIIQV
jgi:hypothetical protein